MPYFIKQLSVLRRDRILRCLRAEGEREKVNIAQNIFIICAVGMIINNCRISVLSAKLTYVSGSGFPRPERMMGNLEEK